MGFFSVIRGILGKFWNWSVNVTDAMVAKYGEDFMHDLQQFATDVVKELMNDKKLTNAKKKSVAFKRIKKHVIESGKGAFLDGDTGLDTMIETVLHMALWAVKVVR